MNVLSMNGVSFSYNNKSRQILNNINASFESGKIYTISGESGSGKTTLISLIAGLTSCYSGTIQYKDKDIRKINKDYYRSNEIGVIFQSYNLLFTDTAAENVELSINLSGNKKKDKKAFAYRLLEKVGLDKEKADRKVLKLSGGEQQRVAIARSLSYDPNLIIADEPTGNLDSKNETGIMEIFQKLAHVEGKCIIIVTHSITVPVYADEALQVRDGNLCAIRP